MKMNASQNCTLVFRRSRFRLESGDRVIDDQGETGTLLGETFYGPWKGYRLGFWVRYDRDYTTRMTIDRLQRLTAPLQDELFKTEPAPARPSGFKGVITNYMEMQKKNKPLTQRREGEDQCPSQAIK
jgi:hypothetical protein